MIKLKVRKKSLSFAAAKKRKTTLKEQDLEKRIAFLERARELFHQCNTEIELSRTT